jgi:hypothetical protein
MEQPDPAQQGEPEAAAAERAPSTTQPPERLICHGCGLRVWLEPDEARVCRECGGYLRHFGPLEGLVDRFFAPPDHVDSVLYRRHLQMVEALWTQDNRGREYYEILRPKLSYSRFEKMVTELVCRGLYQGWAELLIPRSPVPDDAAYRLVFNDPDRFADEMAALFEPYRKR